MRKSSALLSTLIHVAFVTLLLLVTAPRAFVPPHLSFQEKVTRLLPLRLKPFLGSEGGGGQRSQLEASKGQAPPRAVTRLFTMPMVQDHEPKLPLQAALLVSPDIALPDMKMNQWGNPFGKDGPFSGGRGGPAGIGDNGCCGIGDRQGPGIDTGGSPKTVVHISTRPEVLYKEEPEFSEDARKARLQGTVVLLVEIGADGKAHNVRVVHGLGLGLDEKAVEAMARWRFRPATANGKPIPVPATVEVTFHLL